MNKNNLLNRKSVLLTLIVSAINLSAYQSFAELIKPAEFLDCRFSYNAEHSHNAPSKWQSRGELYLDIKAETPAEDGYYNANIEINSQNDMLNWVKQSISDVQFLQHRKCTNTEYCGEDYIWHGKSDGALRIPKDTDVYVQISSRDGQTAQGSFSFSNGSITSHDSQYAFYDVSCKIYRNDIP